MKKILLILAISLGQSVTLKSQVITCLPCDQISMVINVSDTNYINIYHAGQYLTHPQEYNIFSWEFADNQGNILYEDTIVDQQTIAFSHNWALFDTINITVNFVNDSANLNAWNVNQGLPLNGNSINCLFEDQIYWKTGVYPSGIPWGRWEFTTGDYSNPGVDQNGITAINESQIDESKLKIYPSPTSNHLNLEGPKEDYSLQILNIQGQLFHEMKNINGTQKIDVSFLPSGLFFINMNYNNGNQTIRFIKQ